MTNIPRISLKNDAHFAYLGDNAVVYNVCACGCGVVRVGMQYHASAGGFGLNPFNYLHELIHPLAL